MNFTLHNACDTFTYLLLSLDIMCLIVCSLEALLKYVKEKKKITFRFVNVIAEQISFSIKLT